MKEFIIKKIGKTPSFKNPVFIEGFPGIGNVARISVDFMVSKLKAKKFMEIYTYYFPNTVIMTEKHEIEMPRIEFFYHKTKKRDIIFIVGDSQPSYEYESYILTDELLRIAKSFKVKEIITLGGINSRTSGTKPVVYGTFMNEKHKKILSGCGVSFKRQGPIVILGVAGLLLGLGKLRNIKGFTLLAETTSQKMGFSASKQIVEVLIRYLELDISTKDLEKEIKRMDVPKVIKKDSIKKAQDNVNYIG